MPTAKASSSAVRGDYGANSRISPSGLVISHEHDWRSIAQDLDIADKDGVRDQGQDAGPGKDPAVIGQPHTHAVHHRRDLESFVHKPLP